MGCEPEWLAALRPENPHREQNGAVSDDKDSGETLNQHHGKNPE